MARTSFSDRVATSEDYRGLVHKANAHNEDNDCAVKAIAIACDTDYDVVHQMLKEAGRKNGQGTPFSAINLVVRALGYNQITIEPESIIAQYPKAHRILKSVTSHHPKRFAKVWADKPTMMIYTHRHVLTFKDGAVHDWSVGRALRAWKIVRIVKITH